MLSDPAGLMLKMWARDRWKQRSSARLACWDVRRERAFRGGRWQDVPQSPSAFFDGALSGAFCASNWYEGNGGPLGAAGQPPSFASDAPALFGFDETIDGYCKDAAKSNAASVAIREDNRHAARCVQANVNILSLYGDRVPYNICRNVRATVLIQGPRVMPPRLSLFSLLTHTSPDRDAPVGMDDLCRHGGAARPDVADDRLLAGTARHAALRAGAPLWRVPWLPRGRRAVL